MVENWLIFNIAGKNWTSFRFFCNDPGQWGLGLCSTVCQHNLIWNRSPSCLFLKLDPLKDSAKAETSLIWQTDISLNYMKTEESEARDSGAEWTSERMEESRFGWSWPGCLFNILYYCQFAIKEVKGVGKQTTINLLASCVLIKTWRSFAPEIRYYLF